MTIRDQMDEARERFAVEFELFVLRAERRRRTVILWCVIAAVGIAHLAWLVVAVAS